MNEGDAEGRKQGYPLNTPDNKFQKRPHAFSRDVKAQPLNHGSEFHSGMSNT